MFTVNFVYTYQNHDGLNTSLTFPISIPYHGVVLELAHEIVAKRMDATMRMLDAHLELHISLGRFVKEQNQHFYDARDDDLVEQFRHNQIDIDRLIRDKERQYKEEILEYADRVGPTDEEIFAQSFHRLVHSSLLPDILVREKSYANCILDMNARRDSEIGALTIHQQDEMERKIQLLDVSTTSEDINTLLSQQYAAQHELSRKWESELDAKKGHQKNEYRSWITNQSCEQLFSSAMPTPIGNRSSMFVMQSPRMEESFTIHLGSQLKHMHNIRILSADVNELCSPLHTSEESLGGLNMALGLYSCSLCGIVVLTPSGSVQANRKIVSSATMSTEFHFDQINYQIEDIQRNVTLVQGGHGLASSVPSSPANGPKDSTPNGKLKAGDFFVTRHSNLSQTHIIFHLISDEPFNSPDEINSRHPVILGLRNIMKTACRHDVTMLTIPALLRHEMAEDMTVPWCIRRAELIFKCAKGFMIESASWGGAELSTLQLLLPHEISEELFGTLVGMVPHVFRVANAKILEDTTK